MQSKGCEVILSINNYETCEKTQKEIVIITFGEKVPPIKKNSTIR
jgi:hypothetical protein